MTKLSMNQKKKLTKELAMLVVVAVGIIILVCNLLKIVPENNIIVTTIIAYGAIIGTLMVTLGIGGFLEIRDTKINKFSKKAR